MQCRFKFDFHKLAHRAKVEYRYQPGFVDAHVDGDPPKGLRYRFESEDLASRFLLLRSMQRRYDHTGEIWIDGSDVVEVWV